MRPLPVLTALVVSVGILASGCTIPGSTSPSATASAPPASAAPTESSVESESAQAAGVDLTNLPAPIARGSVPATVEGDPDATVEIALHSLKRSGKVVTGTFSFQVKSKTTDRDSLFRFLGSTTWWPYLVDTTNLRKHGVLSGGGARASTDELVRFAPGQTVYAYAMFAAPPDDITTVDVQLFSGLPTATGIPIT